MNERILFFRDYDLDLFDFSELCRQYGISRKTGYKWLARYEIEGSCGLQDRSTAPHSCPHRTPEQAAEPLLALRRRHPTWGPKKLLRVASDREPGREWPAPSTVASMLKAHGLVPSRPRRRKLDHPGPPVTTVTEPNRLWAADFKGQFRLGIGDYCYPLTITDQYSRYLLLCKGLPSTEHDGAKAGFERAFREYGLPDAIRTDNGSPFASIALRRISRLTIWFLRLGIRQELTQPGHPQQNGRHERMHKTLKQETTLPPGSDFWTQQLKFERFRRCYNGERPHEALGQRAPASLYSPSARPYPSKLPEIEYPGHFERRRVSKNGGIRWSHDWINVSHVLAEETVGLEEVDDGIWSIYFGSLLLGRFDQRQPGRPIIGGTTH